MIDKSDIRLKILNKLSAQKKGTEEFLANELLAKIHNDLGSVRRALIDLIEAGYIKESNVDWRTEKENKSVIYSINTIGPPENKSTKRLINDDSIGAIRIYLTLAGQEFLVESENLRLTTWTIRNDWWLKIIYMLIGAGISIAIFYLTNL